MAILSAAITRETRDRFRTHCGHDLRFADMTGRVQHGEADRLGNIAAIRRRRGYAAQESLNRGEPYPFASAPGLTTFAVATEDRRMVHGMLLGPHALSVDADGPGRIAAYLNAHGLSESEARRYADGLPTWPEARMREAAQGAMDIFYEVSGWNPELMRENRLRARQMEQINQEFAERKNAGRPALYAFEKERALLAYIRAGDRRGARRILNEMLAIIYMSSPQLGALRARAVEMTSCLTRAAIEDNALMEPLMERNHAWTEQLIVATSFEDVSAVLMRALDEFMDEIYLHGVNRSNARVRKAMAFIGRHFDEHISLDRLAREAGVSACRISHLIRDCTGRTFLQAQFDMRIRRAQHLLERTSKSCTEIAYAVGFGDQSYFIRHFKRITGTTPARYRRHMHGRDH